ncbi:MAG: exosome complex protein Rrp42 [Candidatus Aenigmatarchaeota archaeon]|nr:exosome complex protein Rrp42 [Candidatus Aenigmarchaeota archaeon]
MVTLKPSESYVRKLVEEKVRIDGRNFDQFREIKIETGVIENAEGSARVRIGNTMVIAGIKADVHEPYPDTPNEGFIVVDCEMVPFASPEYEPGPPSPESVELARVVDRGIRESGSINTEKLCLIPGELVWGIHIDLHVLDNDGNLIDAAALAAIAALLTAKLPLYDPDTKKAVYGKHGEKLPMKDRPVEVTIGKIGTTLMIDTNAEEEAALDARITIATNEDGNICAIQKGGNGYFTTNELEAAVDLAIAKGAELRAMLPSL